MKSDVGRPKIIRVHRDVAAVQKLHFIANFLVREYLQEVGGAS